jgi:hypothetical protein
MDNVSTVCQSSIESLSSHSSSHNASSDFFTSLNSIPNERDFKMAFLNIVSLPNKIDEIRSSMRVPIYLAKDSSSDSSKVKLVKKDFTNFLFGVSI